jgi:histidine triad (HIT) family protein
MSECVFCQIAAGKIDANFLYQDDSVMAFKDAHPKTPVHILIVPIKHIPSTAEAGSEDLPVLAHMLEVANIVAKKAGVPGAYKLVINTGAEAGQVVMHLHMHLLGGKKINTLV